MSLNIVRNDIVKMQTEAIVNTANTLPTIGAGVDSAVYKAAGAEELLKVREEIGVVAEGDAFITPGFNLYAKYIIHTVSPFFIDGESGEEDKLRACYRNSLQIAKENSIASIAFPLIATGSFGYPMADGLRIALDEINAFLLENEMDITIVVFGSRVTEMAAKVYPMLKSYIDHHYVKAKREEEYDDAYHGSYRPGDRGYDQYSASQREVDKRFAAPEVASVSAPMTSLETPAKPGVGATPMPDMKPPAMPGVGAAPMASLETPAKPGVGATPMPDMAVATKTEESAGDADKKPKIRFGSIFKSSKASQLSAAAKSAKEAREAQADFMCMAAAPMMADASEPLVGYEEEEWDELEAFPGENKLKERIKNLSKPFGEYFFYLVEEKGMTSIEVQNGAWISKQVYHKINKNRETYHPDKRTAMQLCVGLKLSLDESRDFLKMAGYTFSPSDLEDIIFSFFLSMDNDEYDIMDVSDALEEYGLKPIVVLKSNSEKGA